MLNHIWVFPTHPKNSESKREKSINSSVQNRSHNSTVLYKTLHLPGLLGSRSPHYTVS